MLEITPQQFTIFEADFRLRRRLRFVAALRACGWIEANFSDKAALDRIDMAIEDAKQVAIVEDEVVVRFVALAFIPDAERRTQKLATLLGLVLTDVDTDPEQRLDFVFAAGRLGRFGSDPLPFAPYRRSGEREASSNW